MLAESNNVVEGILQGIRHVVRLVDFAHRQDENIEIENHEWSIR